MKQTSPDCGERDKEGDDSQGERVFLREGSERREQKNSKDEGGFVNGTKEGPNYREGAGQFG